MGTRRRGARTAARSAAFLTAKRRGTIGRPRQVPWHRGRRGQRHRAAAVSVSSVVNIVSAPRSGGESLKGVRSRHFAHDGEGDVGAADGLAERLSKLQQNCNSRTKLTEEALPRGRASA